MNSLVAVFGGGIIAIFIVVLMVGQLFSVTADGTAGLTGAPAQLFHALPSLWLWFGGALACLIALAVAVQIFK